DFRGWNPFLVLVAERDLPSLSELVASARQGSPVT
ncbi:hypothetical protein A2U01_0089406, partial [Trifolium medium]|nr:hypothetical protein [Trifolium medium]